MGTISAVVERASLLPPVYLATRSAGGRASCGITSLKRIVRFCAGAWLPLQAVILAAISGPGIESVNHGRKFRSKLGDVAQQDALQRRDRLLVAVGRTLLDHGLRPVVVDPIHSQARIELRPERRGKEAVAEEAARCVQDEDHELC